MTTTKWLRLSLLFATLCSCAGSQAAQQLQAGRLALLAGNPAVAVKHFEQAAALDGSGAGSPLQESAWTYVGRSYYEIKDYPRARQALDRALEQNRNDDFARLYLGLTGAREQPDENSRKQIQAGLQGLYDRIEYIKYYSPVGQFWDPSGQLTADLQATIKVISAPSANWRDGLPRVERLALDIEEEIDRARRDESFQRRSGGGGGGDM